MASKKRKPISLMTKAEKEAELLRLADEIGRPQALQIVRQMRAEERKKQAEDREKLYLIN